MLRRIGLSALAGALAFGGIVAMSGPVSAAKPTITATGNVSCAITGKVKIDPPLKNTNTTPSTVTGSGGKINPSTATLKGFVVTAVPDFGFDLPNPNASNPKSTVTGSYAGTNNATAHAHIDVPDTSKCDSQGGKPAKGIKKIAILPGSNLNIS
jgi:hypothetical protein